MRYLYAKYPSISQKSLTLQIQKTMREVTENPLFKCSWLYDEHEIAQKVRDIQNNGQQMNEGIHKIHTFIEFESERRIEQNDLIILNVYAFKSIEIIVYMF